MAKLEVNINVKDIDKIKDLLNLVAKYYNELPKELQDKLIEFSDNK